MFYEISNFLVQTTRKFMIFSVTIDIRKTTKVDFFYFFFLAIKIAAYFTSIAKTSTTGGKKKSISILNPNIHGQI